MASKSKKKKDGTGEPTIENRKARHQYHIDDTLEVGIALRGSEVKSVRAGRMSLGEGYVRAEENPLALHLYGVHIGEYENASGLTQHKPVRPRTLLAHKREIRKWLVESQAKGTTIVPLKAYFKNGRVKVLIGLARGKKQHDKRQDVKKRETDREMRRAMTRKRI
jgi:SsrA-binding protein